MQDGVVLRQKRQLCALTEAVKSENGFKQWKRSFKATELERKQRPSNFEVQFSGLPYQRCVFGV